jgi:hypothetical protein
VLFDANYDLWVALGSILSGIGSIMVGVYALKSARKEDEKDEATEK